MEYKELKKLLNPASQRGFFPMDTRAKEEGESIREMKNEYELERAMSKKKVRNLCAIRGSQGARDRKCLIRVIK